MMSQFVSLVQLKDAAASNLSADLADHIASAAGTEATLRRNLMAFESIAFRPRVLRDVSRVDTSGMVLDRKCRLPVVLAPVASLHRIAPDADCALVRAAGRFGVPTFISSIAEAGFEAIAGAGPGALALQLYVRQDPVEVAAIVKRAQDAGYAAIAVTVDSANYGIRDRQRLGKYPSPATHAPGRDHQARLTWEILDEIMSAAAPIPVMLKGIQTAEDAVQAVRCGVKTLYISNHGGRQLDHSRATLDVLREVRAAIGPETTIILDSGIRRGTDVLKAIALGANAVGLGRLMVWALAAGGEQGVVSMLELLEEEMQNAMALLGVRSLAELNSSYVADVPPLSWS
ncbi:alpha-hydroxy-acid oxidizing enzyme [Agaricicola taiwanensis]|uniref:Alpha-hydroxy-acid oxidizing enzyme n=1 Tax=Agaricicola taiwanensis TaxID=591372 RepID=A0A8J2VLP2_9RHOB|nr:alpha-hydroxy acid oxidase [Agaricicola taiwanensis]GGE30900.1 alpha-hydroxy-acid oxidizing enzyme [Agaricicola taiwanensis]